LNWRSVPLETLGEFRNGLNYTTANDGVGLRILSVKDFGDRSIPDVDGLSEIDPAGLPLEKALLRENDLVFVRSNGNKALVGRSMRIDQNYDNLSFSAFCIRFRVTSSEVDARFLSYYFRSPLFRQTLSSLGQGTNINNLSQPLMRQLPIPCPELPIQEQVVTVLSTYDDLIENNRRRMVMLEEGSRQLYREWFVRLRFPGHEHARIVDRVPEGWRIGTFGSIAIDVRERVAPNDVEGATPYIGLEHIPRRSIALVSWGRADEVTSTKFRFREGDIIFGKIRPYFHKVGIAFVDGVASSDSIVIRPEAEDLRALLLMTVSSDPFVAVAAQGMREGSKMPRADWKLMQQYPVAVPPPGLLGSFTETIDNIVHQLKILTFQNQKLRAARDLLLPRLLSGEITV